MSQTLDAVLQKGQTMPEKNRFPAVLQPVCATGEATHCLTRSHHGSEDGTGRGTPIVIDRAAFNQGENAKFDPHIGPADVMDSLVARGPHAVACVTGDITHCLTASSSNGATEDGTGRGAPIVNAITFQPGNLRREDGAEPSTTTTTTTTLKASAGDQMPHVATPMAVRRLTPNECMRLQGFPDNWANIPWKGKPEGQAPDGPQYRAAGNSMAVPVMRWIGSRIAQVEAGEIK